jgi:hypothetical protein
MRSTSGDLVALSSRSWYRALYGCGEFLVSTKASSDAADEGVLRSSLIPALSVLRLGVAAPGLEGAMLLFSSASGGAVLGSIGIGEITSEVLRFLAERAGAGGGLATGFAISNPSSSAYEF